jgi:bacillithiol biosynthesis cysteine-adding enzyme BshC
MNKLWEAYRSGDGAVLSLFGPRPGDWLAAMRARQRAGFGPLDGAAVDEITAANMQWGVARSVVQRIEQLRRPEARVVVTGQQPGLLAGPLYTLYKAIGAVRWAERIERQFGIPVLPVFWVASEDHDFEEVRSFRWRDAEDVWQTFSYSPQAYRPGLSIHDVPVEPSLIEALADVFGRVRATEFTEPLRERLTAIAAESGDLESMFVRILAWLLGERAPIFVTPRMRFVREGTAPILDRELAEPGETSRRVIDAGRRLAEMGFEPSLFRRPEDVNCFVYRDGLRHKIVKSDGGFDLIDPSDNRRATGPGELRADLARCADCFSLNVVVRPVGQDRVLPTLAYVAGPGEVSYLAQLRGVYEFFGVPMPMILPRPLAMLVEPRVERALAKLDSSIQNAVGLDSAEEFERLVVSESQESAAAQRLEAARRRMDEAVEFVRGQIEASDPAVGRSFEKLKETVRTALEKLTERQQRAALARDAERVRSIATVRDSFWPEGILQERAVTVFFPFLNLFGLDLNAVLFEAVDIEAAGMQPLVLGSLLA